MLRRVFVFDATPSDLVGVVRHGMLGGVTWESLRAWREDTEDTCADGLFGYAAVAGREPAGLALDSRHGRRGDYAFLTSREPRPLPALVADYLRASAPELPEERSRVSPPECPRSSRPEW